MGFTLSLCKKNDRKLFLFGACCKWGRHFYTIAAPSCCVPPSYCHLSATLQTMSITVANLQDNQAVFRIFIPLLRFSFDSPSYIASNEIFSPSNKIHREVGRAKDLPAPLYIETCLRRNCKGPRVPPHVVCRVHFIQVPEVWQTVCYNVFTNIASFTTELIKNHSLSPSETL